jgi:taurine transport system substrate-binding protein
MGRGETRGIAVSQGCRHFVVATVAPGRDLQLLDIAVSYSENDNCVVAADARDRRGQRGRRSCGQAGRGAAGDGAHYGFLRQMEHFGVDVASLEVVDMAPPDGAAAIAQGAVDMFCGFGAALTRAKEHGNVLMTGARRRRWGILVFDVISAPPSFVNENPDLVAEFPGRDRGDERALERRGAGGRGDAPGDRAGRGHGRAGDARLHGDLRLPRRRRSCGQTWLGGGVQEFMGGVAQVFVEAGSIPSALRRYARS